MTYVFQNSLQTNDMIAIKANGYEEADEKLSDHIFSYRYRLLSVNKVELENYKFPLLYSSVFEIKTESSRRI